MDATAHRAAAIEANNSTWEILARPMADIIDADAEEMTRRAYAAAYHWDRAADAGVENEARADWLLSRVWAVRANGDIALHHARRCMAACARGDLADFDLAYAHEALARAHACLGDVDAARRHRDEARNVAIADPEDRDVIDGDLANEPWFGT